jgi:hypothetical protein
MDGLNHGPTCQFEKASKERNDANHWPKEIILIQLSSVAQPKIDVEAERACALEKTYFDVPGLHTAFPSNYLSSGVAYAFHVHHETWYSPPFYQINRWMPIYEISPDNCMAFHPRYWNEAIANSSDTYTYYESNRKSRQRGAQHVKADTHVQPGPSLDPDPHFA